MSLCIAHLASGYGRRTVLADISIPAIEGGSFAGLIGPNASGKSTLFKTIAGLIEPTAGAIHIGQIDITYLKRKDRARRIAYMPQTFGCNALLTVFESVLLALKQTGGWRVE